MTHTTDRGPGQASPEHAGHDLLLIARHAAGDASAAEARTASELVAGCADCAALLRDLHVLAEAMRAAPVLPRRRDFRLTAAQAAELRPPSLWERLRARRALQVAWVQPLAGAVAVAGLVMAVATSGVAIPGFGGPTGGDQAPLHAAASAASQAAKGAAVPASPAASAVPALGLAAAPSAAPTASSTLPPGIKAQRASPTATPQTDMSAAASAAPNPAPAGLVPSPTPTGVVPSSESAASSPQAVLAGPAASGTTGRGERSVGATSTGSATGTGTGSPVWAFWLALALVAGVVFAAAQRVRGRRGT